ncbi:MAG TPA: transposase [Verrucomicrobiae bacterium]|nr:transposase [Verrucomicrobiae bacterium]
MQIRHMPDDPHKHLRRLERVWLESPVYFATACTYRRQPILAATAVADILTEEWRAAAERHRWLVGRYVIMPDHVHFFCSVQSNAKRLSEFVRLWKQWTTKRAVAALAKRGPARLWQQGFFDHVLRSEESYAQKWEYVRQNPVRAGLISHAEDWPFQGEILRL